MKTQVLAVSALASLLLAGCDGHPSRAEQRARARIDAIVNAPAAPVLPEGKSDWRVQAGNAVLTLDMVDAPRPGVVSALILAHRPESGCRTEISVAIAHAASLGTPIRQTRAGSDLRLVVDGGSSWTGPTFATQYRNAQERGFWAPDALVNALLDASRVRATLGDGLPSIEFPVTGAGEAIAAAMDHCHAMANKASSVP